MFAKGVLPDDVIRDPRSEGIFVFSALDPALTVDGARAWLMQVEALIRQLIAPLDGGPVARVAVGFGRSFFFIGDAPRFDLGGRAPIGLAQPPAVPTEDVLPNADVMFYVMSRSEVVVANFLDGLSQTRPLGLTGLEVERGFQRADGREMFGFLDGLRNVPFHERFRVVFVDRDELADEPDWTEDGTYLAYMKIEQDVEAWRALSVEQQEQIMGRRKSDGSRIDLPHGAPTRAEPEYSDGAAIPAESHVRKSGPRGEHGDLKIFRRGVPYFGVRPNGAPEAGLHFASFQASLDQFDRMFNGWMMNPDFPSGLGRMDALFSQDPPLVRIARAGFFFVAPAPRLSSYVGARIFDQPGREPRPLDTGRLFVRKKIVNPDGTPARAELRGIQFEVTRADTGAVEGSRFATDSAGHALSGDLPVRVDLVLREVVLPPTLQPAAPLPFRLERRREVVTVTNFLLQPGPYG